MHTLVVCGGLGRAQPDVVLTDIKMPPAHIDEGIVAAREIRRLYTNTAVVVLSHYLDPGYALRLLEYLHSSP